MQVSVMLPDDTVHEESTCTHVTIVRENTISCVTPPGLGSMVSVVVTHTQYYVRVTALHSVDCCLLCVMM